MDFNRILVLAAHTDDGEFGCGGSIAKFIERGSEIHYIAFSSCQKSVPDGYPSDILIKEVKEATKVLGIRKDGLHTHTFPVREFNHFRQDILEQLVKVERELKPDLVFMPSLNDLHQDHYVIAMESVRAFKKTSILAYEIPWNNINFSTQAFIRLTHEQLDLKVQALGKYRSQAARPYANEDFLRSLARARGVSAGVEYAEAFEVVRLAL